MPTDDSCLGEIALRSLPVFEHVFVASESSLEDAQFNARLFLGKRCIENRLATDEAFYIASLSTGVLSYKGLMMPVDLPIFYKDLADPRLETAICVFHQRFSTNTMPQWPLAQPFRMLAHNGEINTITGNRNWSVARTPKCESPLLPDLTEALPLVNRTGSDSSSLDNMLEFLLVGGMPLHRAIRMLVPPAWNNVDDFDPAQRAYFEYTSMHMEPWDGPAGLVITDGRYAVCTLDRNGLRPSRWVQTKDGFVTVASEVGVYDYKPEDVVAKGRLGPGDILSIDTASGSIRHTDDVDSELASAQPYMEWLRAGSDKIEATMETESMDLESSVSRSELRRYMKMFQASLEERDQVLRPLAESGQEATGSMGDDTPMAVLSKKQRNLFDYFRQQFAQVTNPPIDPLREAIVMSLSCQLGRELNLFSETVEHGTRVNLTSPVLSPRKYYALRDSGSKNYSIKKFSLNYDSRQKSLKEALSQLCNDVEQAVRSGN